MKIYRIILNILGVDTKPRTSPDYYNKSRNILFRFASNYVKPYTKQLLVACFFMCIVAGCTTATVKLASMAVDDVLIAKSPTLAVVVPLFLFLSFLIKGVAEYFQNYLIRVVGQHILNDMQMLLYHHLLYSDISSIQHASSGKLISGFTNDISTIRNVFAYFVVGVAKHLMTVVFLVIAMFNIAPKLAVFAFLAFPLAVIPVQIIGRKINTTAYNTQSKLASYTAKLDEVFSAIKVVKSFQTEETEYSRAKENCDEMLKLYNKNAKLSAIIPGIMEVVNGLTVACILLYQGFMIIKGESTPGTLFGFITGFISAYRPFKYIIGFGAIMQEGLGAAKRIFEILDSKPTIVDPENPVNPEIKDKNIIQLHNVKFSFDGRNVLDDINLEIKSSSIVGIIGHSGSGKTTLSNLLMRFYDINSGEIAINGCSIKNMSLGHLRRHIAYVSQEVMLFDSTIYENIKYGNPHATFEEVQKVAKLADADDFISKLEDGYETHIGQRGYKLSGGQRQRISIARCLLKNAPIMIFDEATSALDYNAENAILNNIKSIKNGKIIFIITHRVLSISDSDLIMVMSEGALEAVGSDKELVNTSDTYRELCRKATAQNSKKPTL